MAICRNILYYSGYLIKDITSLKGFTNRVNIAKVFGSNSFRENNIIRSCQSIVCFSVNKIVCEYVKNCCIGIKEISLGKFNLILHEQRSWEVDKATRQFNVRIIFYHLFGK